MNRPIAVYGTLRPEGGNDWLWRDRATSTGTGLVQGFRLVTNGGFPYALPSATDTITVSLIEPAAEHYEEVLGDMDMLEGVPHHYNRRAVVVETLTGDVVAWMFVPVHLHRVASLPPVEGGDWMKHRDADRHPPCPRRLGR